MAIIDNKILTPITTIQSLARKPTPSEVLTYQQLQAKFDESPEALRNALNKTIDDVVLLDAKNIKDNGNQSIAGIKTFASSPIVPTPTTDMQTSTKKYVDDVGTTKSNDLNTHKLSNDHDGRYYTESEIQALLLEKTNLNGDHQGTWQGFSPSASDPGIQAVVDSHTSQLAEMATHTTDTTKHKNSINCVESGSEANAIGNNNVASTSYAYAEGTNNLACNGTLFNITAFNNATKTITLDKVTGLVVGDLLTIKVNNNQAIQDIPITNINGLIVTLNTMATITAYCKNAILKGTAPYSTHVEGNNSIASGSFSHAENTSIASGSYSHAEGWDTIASGDKSHAEGNSTIASGSFSHTEGNTTKASGISSHAQNDRTIAKGSGQTAIGRCNLESGSEGSYSSSDYLFIVGNGTSDTTRGNAFAIRGNGETLADGAYSSSGADYAEMFEWKDDNLESEDRVGYFVTLEGEKIRKTTSTDTYILGIVSSNPAILGDSQMRWNDKFITDDWGRLQYKKVIIPAEKDKEGNTLIEEHEEEHPILNPAYDNSQQYIEREKRPEWSAVGMMGKLLIRDDGTCIVNGYCKSNDNGIATTSEVGYRVMKRVSANIIQILLK